MAEMAYCLAMRVPWASRLSPFVATWLFAAVVTWIILKILDVTMGLRVSTEDEQMGLDLSQHNEAGYTM